MRTIFEVTSNQLNTYYIFVAILFIYSLFKFRRNHLFILIVCIFFIGLFSFAGKSIQNIYRILTVIYAFYLTQRIVPRKTFAKDPFIISSFALFTIFFISASFLNNDSLTLTLSQYSRYLMIFLFYFIFSQRISENSFHLKINYLFYHLIAVQIILSVLKIVLIGPMESVVGSLAFNGGAIASVIPILGFIFLWMYRQGKFKGNDLLFILGLILIGFVNYKRAIWFMLPVFIMLCLFFVQKLKFKRYIILSALMIPMIIYLGVRLNPTLNMEQKLWGSFDLNYAANYIRDYSFGDYNINEENNISTGRGGALNYLVTKVKNMDVKKNDLFGRGLDIMYIEGPRNEKLFVKQYNINSIGSASGFFQSYVVTGFVGTVFILLFIFSLLAKVKNLRFRAILTLLFLWEFFLYTGMMIREPALSILFVYLISVSNLMSFKSFNLRYRDNSYILPSLKQAFLT